MGIKLQRVSSTRIQRAYDCARKFALTETGGEEKMGEAASVGSLFHSIQEYRAAYNQWPTQELLARQKGNYDDPVDHMRRFPRAFQVAQMMAEHAGHPLDYVPEGFKLVGMEVSLDAMGVHILPGVLCGGFFDMLAVNDEGAVWVGDWKTRGPASWRARPITREDFAANIQFSYYAAAHLMATRAAGQPDPPLYIVEHINVLRPPAGKPSSVKCDRSVYSVAYLEQIWAWLRDKMVPAMVEAVADVDASPKNESACFMYGPCAFMTRCGNDDLRHAKSNGMDVFEMYAAQSRDQAEGILKHDVED